MSSRLVLDTNVLVSAYGWGGKPAWLVAAVVAGELKLITSPALLAELGRVLTRGEQYDEVAVRGVIEQLLGIAEVVRPTERLRVVADDSDNRVLECALEAAVDLIVSGDRHLLDLGSHAGIDIVNVAVALERFGIEEVAL